MSITPITAAEIGVLVTQKPQTSSWGSRVVSSTFLKSTAIKIMKIVAILLILGLVLTVIDVWMEHNLDRFKGNIPPAPVGPPAPFTPTGPINPIPPATNPSNPIVNQRPPLPENLPQGDIKNILSEAERNTLINKLASLTKPIGINNHGNDCFMNSCMQYIMHSELYSFFLDPKNLKPEVENAVEFYRLFVWFAEGYAEGKSDLRSDYFRRYVPCSEGTQEDSYDALGSALHFYHQERISQTKIVKLKANDTRIPGGVFHSQSSHNASPLVELDFPDQNSSKVPIKSLWKESFHTKLEDYIVSLSEEQKIKANTTTKDEEFDFKLPDLLLRAKRFKKTLNEYGMLIDMKVDNKIDFSDALPLNFGNKHFFDLVAFTVQRGTLRGGHYVSYVKRQGQWYFISDSSVSKPLVEEDALKFAEDGYMFYFKQIPRPRSDSSSSDSSSDDGASTPRSIDLLSDDELPPTNLNPSPTRSENV